MEESDFSGDLDRHNYYYPKSPTQIDDSILLSQINDLQYQNDILSSQVKYYKKQCLEKDNYIFYLKEKITALERSAPPKIDDEMSLSYLNYNSITLPERIKRDKNNSLIYNSHNNSIADNNNTNNVNSSSTLNTKYEYERNGNYGYDYKEPVSMNLQSASTVFHRVAGSQNELKDVPMPPPRTISGGNVNANASNNVKPSGKLMNIMMNICHCDSNMINKLQMKYGNDVIVKINNKQIDNETLKKIDEDINKERERQMQEEEKLIKETRTQIYNQQKSSLGGWNRLKNYLKLGKEFSSIKHSKTIK
jgi:hypothetical protein